MAPGPNLRGLPVAACFMLDHVGRKPMADRIRHAVDHVIRDDRLRTLELSGKAKTKDFAHPAISDSSKRALTLIPYRERHGGWSEDFED